jgi:hypothetical protein
MSATQPSMNPAYTSSAAGRPGQPARLHPSNTDALRGSSGGGAHSPRSMQVGIKCILEIMEGF